jgi:hypothetical protein
MATPSIQTIMVAIEAELDGRIVSAGTLEFLVGENTPTVISDSAPTPDRFKNYKNYQIVLFPDPAEPFREENRLGENVWREYNIGFVLYQKSTTNRRTSIFSDSNNTTRGVGIYEFANLIMDALRNNTFGGVCERRSGEQFSTPVLSQVDDQSLEQITFTFRCETLSQITSGAIV